MASFSSNTSIVEGQSINRPSFFDGNNYNYWKCRMVIYLKSINFDLWNVVVNDYTPSKKNYKEWNKDDKKLATLDVKGLNILLCAINEEQFICISNCSTSQEAWYNLEVKKAPLCFKCNKLGHMKNDCSLLKMKTFKRDKRDKKEIKKKMALQAT